MYTLSSSMSYNLYAMSPSNLSLAGLVTKEPQSHDKFIHVWVYVNFKVRFTVDLFVAVVTRAYLSLLPVV